MNKLNRKPRNDKMYEAILSLRTVEECKKFFDDLCSISELMAMEQRFQVASCLSEGMIYLPRPAPPALPSAASTAPCSTAAAATTSPSAA